MCFKFKSTCNTERMHACHCSKCWDVVETICTEYWFTYLPTSISTMIPCTCIPYRDTCYTHALALVFAGSQSKHALHTPHNPLMSSLESQTIDNIYRSSIYYLWLNLTKQIHHRIWLTKLFSTVRTGNLKATQTWDSKFSHPHLPHVSS